MQEKTPNPLPRKGCRSIRLITNKVYEVLSYGLIIGVRLFVVYPSILVFMAVSSILLVNEMSDRPTTFGEVIYAITTDIRDTTINATPGHIETTQCASTNQLPPANSSIPTFKCDDWIIEEMPLNTWSNAVADGMMRAYIIIVIASCFGAILILGPRRVAAMIPKSDLVAENAIFVAGSDKEKG